MVLFSRGEYFGSAVPDIERPRDPLTAYNIEQKLQINFKLVNNLILHRKPCPLSTELKQGGHVIVYVLQRVWPRLVSKGRLVRDISEKRG